MNKLLEVKNLTTNFHIGVGTVQAVRNVSFHLNAGESLGIVGESGSGKSTSAKVLMNLQKPSGGEIIRRAKGMQMVFQDPYSSLDPRMTIGQIIEEGLVTHMLQ